MVRSSTDCPGMWQALPYGPDEVCCQKTALSFVDSVAELFGPLTCMDNPLLLQEQVFRNNSSASARSNHLCQGGE